MVICAGHATEYGGFLNSGAVSRFGIFVLVLSSSVLSAQSPPRSLLTDLKSYVETPAIPGYETRLADQISTELASFHPQRDSLGDVVIRIGSGSPQRLIVAPMDEPGFVVSGMDDSGYLRLQRLPQSGMPAHFNELHTAQPMEVGSTNGKLISGVMAGTSIHLQPGRKNPPNLDDLDNLYVDVGAQTREAVANAGIHILDPVAEQRTLLPLGASEVASRAVGDRFGDAVLVDVLRHLRPQDIKGTLTIAFVAQQWTGARGLTRLLVSTHPDELIYLGRALPPAKIAEAAKEPGSGLVLAGSEATPNALAADLMKIATATHIQLSREVAAPLIGRGYGIPIALPDRVAHLAVPMKWPMTPAETLDFHDLLQLSALLQTYLQGNAATPEPSPKPSPVPSTDLPLPASAVPEKPSATPSPDTLLKSLILTYGISEHEELPREAIQRLLPPWAKTEVDAGGNLILHVGNASQGPKLLFMAHMDEIGYVVRNILPDGSLEIENKGGGAAPYFWGHPVLLHTGSGLRAGVIELPANYQDAAFSWPTDIRASAQLYVGAHSPAEVAALGIKAGDTMTVLKSYRPLLGHRVSARSLDDRVGCAALLHAVWALGPNFHGADVTFVWSTREELGLLGAGEYADEANRTGKVPDFVFAIDTFVSSDSPLESPRFADARLGEGFVIRAVDNSNIVPQADVARLLALAHDKRIPIQYGVTGGGNDGSAFFRYGSTDVALGWPLRYSHSPAEVIDTRDLDALADAVADISRNWSVTQ
jgi:putative aminopeptidase FrvX